MGWHPRAGHPRGKTRIRGPGQLHMDLGGFSTLAELHPLKKNRAKRCSLPSPSLPFHTSSNPLVMWGIIGAGSPRRAKTSSFYQSEAPRPPWVETAARVHFYLYPLQGSFFVHWPVVPLVHHPTCRHLSHLSSWVLPGPDAGFPNMPC